MAGTTPWANAGLIPVVNAPPPAGTHVITVGVGRDFATISAAVSAAQDGDLIRVDAGTYTNDFATVKAKITLEGVGGMVNMVATVPPPNLKGIATVDNNVTIKNFSFSGSAIPDASGGNGAGIRYEGGNMVLINDSFIGNQDGILAFPVLGMATNTITIDHSLFSGNGSGTGYTHNLYVNAVDNLTATNSIFENAVVGHEFKSRALVNDIENNIFRDGPTGTASYSIDLPNGGADLIKNNYIEKGPLAPNQNVIHFGGEGIPYAGSSLTIESNTIVNHRGPNAEAVLNQTVFSTTITNNILDSFGATKILAGPGVLSSNVNGAGAAIGNSTLTAVLPGATTVYTDNLAHTISLTKSNTAVQGGGGRLAVNAVAGHVVAIGGSGGMDVVESVGSGGNSFSTVAGSVNSLRVSGQDLIDSRGTDRIVAGVGNITGQISGNAIIDDGFNDDKWTIVGKATILGHGGRPVARVGAVADLTVTGSLGYLEIINNGGKAQFDFFQNGVRNSGSIVGGAVDAKFYSGAMTIKTAPGTSGATIRLGAGDATITSLGRDTIFAGSGNETIIVSADAKIYAGTGNLAVYGRGDTLGASFYGNGGTYRIDGDSGNITYYGGALNSTIQAVLSNITLIGGAGLLTINGGSRETITGGAGGILYNASGGANTISTTANARNTLNFTAANKLDSWGIDTIHGGTGNQTMTIHGNSVVYGSTGNSRLTFSGNDTLIGSGYDIVTVTAGARLTVSAGTNTTVYETGATVIYSITGGAAPANATVTGGGATVSTGAGRSIAITTDIGAVTDIALGGGTIAVTSRGADTIHAGNGADTIVLTRANTQIWGGTGSLKITNSDYTAGHDQTVRGDSGAISYSQSNGDLRFIGGSGDVTISGSAGTLYITAGSGNTTVVGGWGAGLRFTAGSGTADVALTTAGGELAFGSGNTTATLMGYGSATIFDFIAGSGGGSNVIQNFRAGTDRLSLQGVSVKSLQTAGGSTNLVLSDNTRLQLVGVTNTTPLFG